MAQNRKRVIYLPLVCFVLLTLSAFLVLTQSYAYADESESTSREWTLLVYYAGDNDLENDIEKTLSALEHVEGNKVQVVVMVDELSAGGIKVHEINGSEYTTETFPEANTANPATIEWFVTKYGMSEYTYEKTMLIIKGYGFSWRGVCLDETNGNQIMPFDGLADALRDKGIDLLMFDAERMSMLEIAYNLRDTADYMIATQSIIPNDGIPYDLFLAKLYKILRCRLKNLPGK